MSEGPKPGFKGEFHFESDRPLKIRQVSPEIYKST